MKNNLYDNYYKTQASRSSNADLQAKLKEDFFHLSKEILPVLPGEKNIRILEIGCGYGNLLLLLQQCGYNNAEGIDISEAQINKANELGLKNVYLSDIKSFLLSSQKQWDVIIGLDIIEHIQKDELLEILNLAKNKLSIDGTMIFRTPNIDAPFGSTFAYGDITHELILNYFSAEQLMLNAGFSNVEVTPSFIHVKGIIKNLLRKILWWKIKMFSKLILFASGKSTRNVTLTPNLIIRVRV